MLTAKNAWQQTKNRISEKINEFEKNNISFCLSIEEKIKEATNNGEYYIEITGVHPEIDGRIFRLYLESLGYWTDNSDNRLMIKW